MKKDKKFALAMILLFILSVIYIFAYAYKLKEIGKTNFTIYYSVIYVILALPIFFFSISAIFGLIIQKWADKPISAQVQKYCRLVTFFILALYVIYVLAWYPGLYNNRIFYGIFYWITNNPVLFVVPGLCSSVGFNKLPKEV